MDFQVRFDKHRLQVPFSIFLLQIFSEELSFWKYMKATGKKTGSVEYLSQNIRENFGRAFFFSLKLHAKSNGRCFSAFNVDSEQVFAHETC